MKKVLIIMSVLVIALTFGTAYAMSAGEYNGITAFEKVVPPSHDLASGLTLGNGITAFDIQPLVYAEGSAAGGLRLMEPSREWKNGITVF
jgi:hypothetical protein